MLSLPPIRVAVLGAGLNPSEKANLYGHECREGIMCLPSSAYWLADDDAYAVETGAAFALTRASRRARTRSVGSRSRSRSPLFIFDQPPPSLPQSGVYAAIQHGWQAGAHKQRLARPPAGLYRNQSPSLPDVG
jgi:hypothetical protein